MKSSMMEIEKKHPTLGDYILLKTLGAGYNSKVKLGYSKKDGKHYAVKVIKRTNVVANEKAIKNEVGIMKNLKHPNLVNLIEFMEKEEYFKTNGSSFHVMSVVLELATGGELFEYVANTGRFSEPVARTYFHQMIDALEYLHKNNIAHRDMKPENLLFDEGFNLKIADFGFSTFLNRNLQTVLGTESYMAPEIHARQPYNGPQVDLFASAIILFIMFSGTPPFTKADTKDPYYRLFCTNKVDTFWAAHQKHKQQKDFFPEDFKNLITTMLSYDPSKRLTIDQIRDHPWFKGDILTMDALRKEFNKRKDIVDKELETQRIKKALEREKQKQKQKPENFAYTGVRGFRSIGEESEFAAVEQEFKEELKLKRALKKDEVPNIVQDFVTVCDADYLFKAVLKDLLILKEQKDIVDIKLSKDAYKINAIYRTEDDNIEIAIKLSSVDDDTNVVRFSKKNGSGFKYYEVINKIKANLEKEVKLDEEKSEKK